MGTARPHPDGPRTRRECVGSEPADGVRGAERPRGTRSGVEPARRMTTSSAPDDEVADLLVVGYGPVGATLTGLAARHGLSVVAVDREVDLYPLPRAAHCDHEILRILQELG